MTREGLIYANLANSLGEMEGERGHMKEAHKYIDKSLEIRRRLLPPVHEEVANGLNNYAKIIFQNLDTGDCETDLEMYIECIEINIKCLSSHSNRGQFTYIRNSLSFIAIDCPCGLHGPSCSRENASHFAFLGRRVKCFSPRLAASGLHKKPFLQRVSFSSIKPAQLH